MEHGCIVSVLNKCYVFQTTTIMVVATGQRSLASTGLFCDTRRGFISHKGGLNWTFI